MTSYAYTAINARGLEVDGVIAANDLASAREQLQRRGLLAEKIAEIATGASLGEKRISLGGGVKQKSLQIFSRQFATMIEAGLSVVQALVVLEDQTSDVALAEVVTQLRYDVEAGLILSEAMARHPKVFSRLYIAMVEAGEAAGILDIVLDRVAVQIEKQEAIRRRVKGAMIYPTLVLVFATCILIARMLFLIPIFVKIFASLHGNLPLLTQIVIHVSNAIRGYYYVIIPLIVAMPFAFRSWKRTDSGRKKWDRFLLRIPMKIGETARKVAMARFSRTLATLVAAGVDIIRALEITGSAAASGSESPSPAWMLSRTLTSALSTTQFPAACPVISSALMMSTPAATRVARVREKRAIATFRAVSPIFIGMRRRNRSHFFRPESVLFHERKANGMATMSGMIT